MAIAPERPRFLCDPLLSKFPKIPALRELCRYAAQRLWHFCRKNVASALDYAAFNGV
jgi:hypothetical protein